MDFTNFTGSLVICGESEFGGCYHPAPPRAICDSTGHGEACGDSVTAIFSQP